MDQVKVQVEVVCWGDQVAGEAVAWSSGEEGKGGGEKGGGREERYDREIYRDIYGGEREERSETQTKALPAASSPLAKPSSYH